MNADSPQYRRYLAILLPQLPADRIRLQRQRQKAAAEQGLPSQNEARVDNPRPLVTIEEKASAMRLASVCRNARAIGLHAGQALADARAMFPDLDAVHHDAETDALWLERLTRAATRYTPLAAIGGSDSILLDITGCAHLFGGEENMRADIAARLKKGGFLTHTAIAETATGALVLARGLPSIAPNGGLATALRPLSIRALWPDETITATLERLGLKQIGQVMRQPRASLTTRFGKTFLDRLDAALGAAGDPVSPLMPVPAFCVERRLGEPLLDQGAISALRDTLLPRLMKLLERQGEGVLLLDFDLFTIDGGFRRTSISLSRPSRDTTLLGELLDRKAETQPPIEVGFGFDQLRLAARMTAPIGDQQTPLTPPSEQQIDARADQDDERIARLVDRLAARFGLRKITRLVPQDRYVPEFAVASVAAPLAAPAALAEAWRTTKPHRAERPLRLLEYPEPVDAIAEVPDGPPVRFRWRRVMRHVARAEGPERISAEWWLGGDMDTRDYFRVEDDAGRRYWLFRKGLYGRETGTPQWFMHGLFA